MATATHIRHAPVCPVLLDTLGLAYQESAHQLIVEDTVCNNNNVIGRSRLTIVLPECWLDVLGDPGRQRNAKNDSHASLARLRTSFSDSPSGNLNTRPDSLKKPLPRLVPNGCPSACG